MKNAAMACMRNEAMFVLEWVAYHKIIGFDDLFVCTNACDDGTDDMLDLLEEMGEVHHVRNDERGKMKPQPAGVGKVLAHPALIGARWLLHIDSDEFLNILQGDGHLRDWLPTVDRFDAVAVSWRTFGDNGLHEWTGGLQLEEFTRANRRLKGYTGHNKTMFRPDAFRAGTDHMPKEPVREGLLLGSAFGRGVDAGALYDPKATDHRLFGENRQRHFRWEGATINHYAIRSIDCFMQKTKRGSGIKRNVGTRYKMNSKWHQLANCNEVEERTIQRHLPAVKALLKAWTDECPELADIQARAFEMLKAERAELMAA